MKKAALKNMPTRTPLMKCIEHSRQEGYTADFFVKNDRLCSQDSDKKYKLEEISIISFCRFEGMSNPSDNAILYLLETDDGTKGTLSEAYGVYAQGATSDFMRKLEALHNPQKDKNVQSIPVLDN